MKVKDKVANILPYKLSISKLDTFQNKKYFVKMIVNNFEAKDTCAVIQLENQEELKIQTLYYYFS